jgi:hypothetical protein
MVSHAPPTIVPPTVLRPDWETIVWLASRRSKPLDLDACPAPSSLRRFCGTIKKLKPAWFWGPNEETVAVILTPKSPNRSCKFWVPNRKTRATGFEAKPEKTVRVVLRSNHSQTVDLGFEAQPRNLRSSSTRARCRPHTASPDLPIVRPPSTQPVRPSLVLCTRSPTPVTILVVAHHAAPSTYTPRDKQTRFSTWNKW